MRRLLLALLLTLLARSATAQTVTIQAIDPNTQTTTDVGDAIRQAVRVSLQGPVYNEDSASGGNDTGILILAIRQDTLANSTNQDGDFANLKVDNLGALWVNFAGLYAEDAAHITGDKGTPALTRRITAASVTSTAGTDGDYALLNTDENGMLMVNCPGCAGGVQYDEDSIAANGEKLTMAGVVRIDTPASLVSATGDRTELIVDNVGALWVNTELPAPVTSTTGMTNNPAPIVLSFMHVRNGGTWDPAIASTEIANDAAMTIGTTSGPPVMARASAAAPAAVSADNDAVHLWALRSGALAVQPTYSGVLAVQIANDAPITVGTTQGDLPMFRASAAAPTNVSADNDAVHPWALRSGALAIQPTYAGTLELANPCRTVAPTTTAISTTADQVLIAAASAKKTYICGIMFTSTTAESVGLVEGTGATCGTGTAALMGSTTDANDPAFGATGGVAYGVGVAPVINTAGTNVDVCLKVNTGGIRVAGSVIWVQQ